MSLLACQPLYSIVKNKRGLILGGLTNLNSELTTGSTLKLDFSTETVVDTSQSLGKPRAFLAALGFTDLVVSTGGSTYNYIYNVTEKYDLATDTTSSSALTLSQGRHYSSSSANSTTGLVIGGKVGRPVALLEEYDKSADVFRPSNYLSRGRAGHTSSSNAYESIIVGFNDSVEVYNFETKSIYTKFSSKLSMVGQSSASTTDLMLLSGGRTNYPVAYQYKLKYSDTVELPVSHLSVPRMGGSSLSNNAVAYTLGGTTFNSVDKFNFFDNSTYVAFNLQPVRYFSGYASNCHGGMFK